MNSRNRLIYNHNQICNKKGIRCFNIKKIIGLETILIIIIIRSALFMECLLYLLINLMFYKSITYYVYYIDVHTDGLTDRVAYIATSVVAVIIIFKRN